MVSKTQCVPCSQLQPPSIDSCMTMQVRQAVFSGGCCAPRHKRGTDESLYVRLHWIQRNCQPATSSVARSSLLAGDNRLSSVTPALPHYYKPSSEEAASVGDFFLQPPAAAGHHLPQALGLAVGDAQRLCHRRLFLLVRLLRRQNTASSTLFDTPNTPEKANVYKSVPRPPAPWFDSCTPTEQHVTFCWRTTCHSFSQKSSSKFDGGHKNGGQKLHSSFKP